LYNIKGSTNVWVFKKRVAKNYAAFLKYGTIDEYTTVKPEASRQLSEYVIRTNEGDLSPEKVIDWLFEDSDKPDFIFDFDKQTDDVKKQLMERYVPAYDSIEFKVSHMSRIYKWFNSMHKALNKV